MPRAVKFSRYGGSDVLEVVDVDQPNPGPGEVVVRVVAAATNPGEIKIREGAFADVWPATFPEGQGNDFSGRVAEVGPGEAGFSPGDEVMGFTPRAAQADYVRSASDRLARKPPGVPWEVAAAIPAAGATAYAAVRAVRPRPGETVVVSAAAELTIPIQSVYPLERVRDAYDELAARHTRGKIVLRVNPD